MRPARTSAALLALLVGLASSCGGGAPSRSAEAAASAGAADLRGVVFEDADADGVREPGERGLAGVAVSNGREVVRTGPDGGYRLPAPASGGFVFVTRPRGFDAPLWYRAAARGGGDFALRRARDDGAEFFFVQVSDAHVYDRAADLEQWSMPHGPAWLPRALESWLGRTVLRRLTRQGDEVIEPALREALAASRGAPVDGLAGNALLEAYLAEFARPGSRLGSVAAQIRTAFQEVAALHPSFVVDTGDLILEGNRATPAVARHWLEFYLEVARETGVPFYDTIGNNEIVGSENDSVDTRDPDYGKGLWHRLEGPSAFSFDRGDLHFVALDSHEPTPRPWSRRRWSFVSLREDEREWLDRDLALHADRTLVVLNHEPFSVDPSWGFAYEPVSDGGLFARRGVRYVLCGHIHRNGAVREDGVEHVTTGALSGLRWLLPPGLYERGYRLWYAKDGHLFGVWKRTGEPVIARAALQADPAHVVFAAADRSGPFASIELHQGGAPVPLERWGDYFARAGVDPAGGELVVTARRSDGSEERAVLAAPDVSAPAR